MQSTLSPETLMATHDEGARDELLAAVNLPSIDASPPRVPSLETGVVRGVASGILVELRSGTVLAKRAKSCLVVPDADDRVLCALDGEQVFVLAVLEGEPGAATRIVAEGDLKVHATGRLGLGAGDQIDIAAPKEIGLFTGKLRVRAQAAVAAIEELGLVGRALDAQLQSVVVTAEKIETRAERFLQRAKQAYRFIEALEQVRVGVLDVRAEGLAAIRGENVVVAARTLAKLDGEQVKIG